MKIVNSLNFSSPPENCVIIIFFKNSNFQIIFYIYYFFYSRINTREEKNRKTCNYISLLECKHRVARRVDMLVTTRIKGLTRTISTCPRDKCWISHYLFQQLRWVDELWHFECVDVFGRVPTLLRGDTREKKSCKKCIKTA